MALKLSAYARPFGLSGTVYSPRPPCVPPLSLARGVGGLAPQLRTARRRRRRRMKRHPFARLSISYRHRGQVNSVCSCLHCARAWSRPLPQPPSPQRSGPSSFCARRPACARRPYPLPPSPTAGPLYGFSGREMFAICQCVRHRIVPWPWVRRARLQPGNWAAARDPRTGRQGLADAHPVRAVVRGTQRPAKASPRATARRGRGVRAGPNPTTDR